MASWSDDTSLDDRVGGPVVDVDWNRFVTKYVVWIDERDGIYMYS